jgi:uncharacterized cupredoxin-like copper-binding protein
MKVFKSLGGEVRRSLDWVPVNSSLRQRIVRRPVICVLAGLLISGAANAEGDLTRQEPIVVKVELGTADDALVFAPGSLVFETGKLYRLVLHNPSKTKHYFTSPGLADRVFTRKVQVMDADGTKTVAEIKGAIREIEVYPGGTAEWWFVPAASVAAAELSCHVKDEDGKTHAEKGMTGVVQIK